MKSFNSTDLKKLYIPANKSQGEDNGQVTIIGGSDLFHGAPILSLKVSSRIVDMVFFTSPEPGIGGVANHIKSKLMSFIWVPFEEVEYYIAKSDAVLIGPGMKSFRFEKNSPRSEHRNPISVSRNLKTDIRHLQPENSDLDSDGKTTRKITEKLLKKFPDKKWVIDAGSLQTMDPEWIPEDAVLTPNKREFEMLFGSSMQNAESSMQSNQAASYLVHATKMAGKYKCVIVAKGPETFVVSPTEVVRVKGGNAGLTKGGTGDILAGLTAALLAKNNPFLSACSASCIEKVAADDLYEEVGMNYNADDLADQIPLTFKELLKS